MDQVLVFLKKNKVSLFIFAVLSLFFWHPILKNIFFFGEMDWDQYFFWRIVSRDTLLRFKEFPFWNPYTNGGNVFFAHTHSFVLSPVHLLVLLFGAVAGVKLQIILFSFLGLVGMFVAGSECGLKGISRLVPPVIYMFSSYMPLHIAEGHGEYIYVAVLPWLFFFFSKAQKSPVYICFTAIVFALTILGGGIDVLFISIVVMGLISICFSIKKRSLRPVLLLGIAFAASFFLSAVKLLPVLETLSHDSRQVVSEEKVTASLLLASLFERDQSAYYQVSKWTSPEESITYRGIEFEYGFHEYGAYIGLAVFFLFLLGVIRRREQWWIPVVGFCSLWIATGSLFDVSLWGWLHELPLYSSLRVPSRFILGFLFCVSLGAGYGFSCIQRKGKNSLFKVFLLLLLLLIITDFYMVSNRLIKDIFTIKPVPVARKDAFAQRYRGYNDVPHLMRSNMFRMVQENSGNLIGYDVLEIEQGRILCEGESSYKGELYLAEGNGDLQVAWFSPNKIKGSVHLNTKDVLVLNQNYYKDWKAEVNGHQVPVVSHNGLVSISMPEGNNDFVIYFFSNSFLFGLCVSGISFIIMSIYIKKHII